MNRLIICAMLLVTTTAGFSQQTNPSPVLTKQDYLQKSRHQKTAAWVLLSTGIFSTALGTVRFNFAGSDGEVDNSASTIFLVSGLAAMGASIPFFIASSKNKKKAASAGLHFERMPVLQQQQLVYHSYPALSLGIVIN